MQIENTTGYGGGLYWQIFTCFVVIFFVAKYLSRSSIKTLIIIVLTFMFVLFFASTMTSIISAIAALQFDLDHTKQ